MKKKVIFLAPSKELGEMAEKSKFELLAEKFLLLVKEKSVTVIRATAELSKKMRLFWLAQSFVPIGVIAYFFVPETYFARIVGLELSCRVCVGLVLGCMFCNAFFLQVLGMRSFLAIPLFLWYCLKIAKESFFFELVGDPVRARLFFCLGFGFVFPPLIYLPNYIIWRIRKWLAGAPVASHFFGFSDEKEIQKELQNALKHASKLNSKELERLIRDYSPEYTSIVEQLKDDEIEAPDFAQIDMENLTEPKTVMECPIYLGRTSEGEDKYADLDASPHMLVAGTTGGGKSNFVEHYICSLLNIGNSHLYVLDPSDDLYGYSGNDSVTYVTELEKARQVVKDVAAEIDKRAKVFKEKRGVRKLSQWKGKDRPKRIFVIFDEYASFCNDKELVASIDEIVRLGRKYGLHLLLATQSPRTDVFKGSIKDNINTKVAFRAATAAHAAVLGEKKARLIKEEQKGLAVIGGSFVQTPLCDNRRWWNEDAGLDEEEEEEINRLPKEPKKRRFLLPAKKGEAGAFFLSKEELENRLGGNPKSSGFKKVRVEIDGKYRRGFWVK